MSQQEQENFLIQSEMQKSPGNNLLTQAAPVFVEQEPLLNEHIQQNEINTPSTSSQTSLCEDTTPQNQYTPENKTETNISPLKDQQTLFETQPQSNEDYPDNNQLHSEIETCQNIQFISQQDESCCLKNNVEVAKTTHSFNTIEEKKEELKEIDADASVSTSNPSWNYQFREFSDIDFEKYEKENLEHMKKVYKPPHLSDVIDEVVEQDNGLEVQTIPQFSIPKCNVIKLDMSFLSSWQCKEIIPQFTMYSPPLEGESLDGKAETNETIPTIDKKWCRDVQVRFEERDQNGELFDKYRVTKEVRTVKLQGEISVKWYVCLEQMKPNECKWFKLERQFLQKICQQAVNSECIYLKIQILSVRALALSEMKDKIEQAQSLQPKQQQQLQLVEYDFYQLLEKAEESNNQGKKLFSLMDYEKAAKLFNKAFSIWKGMTKKARKNLDEVQQKTFLDKSNQYGANYAQCLMNMKKYQECVVFYSQSKLNSSKNLYKQAKSLFELHDYEKAIIIIESCKIEGENPSLPPELEKLKVQCSARLKQLECQSINNFYKKLFV